MPTAAKLFGALFFAAAGFWIESLYEAELPDSIQIDYLPILIAVLGLMLGWRSMGAVAGKGWRESIGYGLRTSVLMVFLAMLLVAVWIMLRKSTHQMYRSDPVAAVLDVPQLMSDYGKYMLRPNVLGAVAAAGIVGGILTEAIARRWR